jgi:hypothetical protein
MQLASDFLSGGGGGRTKRLILTASNPAVPVPAWAKLVYVSGVGAGGGGASSPGGAGAHALRHPVVIPSGIDSLGVAIGVGGAAGTGEVNGAMGGASTLSFGGTEVLRLRGGAGGYSAANSSGGLAGSPSVFGASYTTRSSNTSTSNVFMRDILSAADIAASASAVHQTLFRGMSGYGAGSIPETMNAINSTPSLFGCNGQGYGYGGRERQPGGNGLLILEFVEGF